MKSVCVCVCVFSNDKKTDRSIFIKFGAHMHLSSGPILAIVINHRPHVSVFMVLFHVEKLD